MNNYILLVNKCLICTLYKYEYSENEGFFWFFFLFLFLFFLQNFVLLMVTDFTPNLYTAHLK